MASMMTNPIRVIPDCLDFMFRSPPREAAPLFKTLNADGARKAPRSGDYLVRGVPQRLAA
jgi:hypothetical protein